MTVNEGCSEYALGLLSYLSVLCRISFPFFHRLIAGGEAWGLHSRVTSLPERAFSKALNGLFEKLGGEAVCGEAEKGCEIKIHKKKAKPMQINHAVMRLNLLQCSVRLHHELNMKRPVGSSQCNSLQPNLTPPHPTAPNPLITPSTCRDCSHYLSSHFVSHHLGPSVITCWIFFQVSQMEVIKASQINQ